MIDFDDYLAGEFEKSFELQALISKNRKRDSAPTLQIFFEKYLSNLAFRAASMDKRGALFTVLCEQANAGKFINMNSSTLTAIGLGGDEGTYLLESLIFDGLLYRDQVGEDEWVVFDLDTFLSMYALRNGKAKMAEGGKKSQQAQKRRKDYLKKLNEEKTKNALKNAESEAKKALSKIKEKE